MRVIISSLLILVLTGCSTLQPADDRTNAERLAPIIRITAAEGTEYILYDHPEWLPKFELAVQSLAKLQEGDNITLNHVLEIVRALPVKELRSREARLAFNFASLVLDEYGRSVKLDDQTATNIKVIAAALEFGIRTGIKNVVIDTSVANK